MSPLSSRPETIAPSGICTIQYIETGDIENVILKYPENNMIDIKPKAGKNWTEIYFTPKTVKIKHDPRETPAGETHEYRIEHHIPSNRFSAAQSIAKLRNKLFYVRLVFLNNNARIFGESENGMRFQAIEKLGSAPLIPDGYNIIWYGKFSRPAAYDFNIH